MGHRPRRARGASLVEVLIVTVTLALGALAAMRYLGTSISQRAESSGESVRDLRAGAPLRAAPSQPAPDQAALASTSGLSQAEPEAAEIAGDPLAWVGMLVAGLLSVSLGLAFLLRPRLGAALAPSDGEAPR